MFFRTDLALELKEGGQSELLDVPCKIKEKNRCKISHITVPCHIQGYRHGARRLYYY